jgi:hypothetical protein
MLSPARLVFIDETAVGTYFGETNRQAAAADRHKKSD